MLKNKNIKIIIKIIIQNKKVQQLADAEDWARYDYNSAMSEMMEKGLELGEKETNLKIIKRMLEKKMDIDLISELTGLTKEEIESLL